MDGSGSFKRAFFQLKEEKESQKYGADGVIKGRVRVVSVDKIAVNWVPAGLFRVGWTDGKVDLGFGS